jgi:UDP-N-acetylmuramate dehydrogenase
MLLTENQPLAPLTTFGIGGPARWFAQAQSEADVAEACEWARVQGLPLFVLGGGSNVLVSDRGFPGLVLRIGLMGIERDGDLFRVAAGAPWEHCVQQTIESGYAGLECLAGIPGTVGGTPVQNVGAYGQEVSSVIERVRVFDKQEQRFLELSNRDCGFAYRRSRFNSTDRGRFIVTSVDYRLRPGGDPHLAYADLKRHFQNHSSTPSLSEVAEAVRSVRRRKGMLLVEGDPDCRSAGSFFKNPTVLQETAEKIHRDAEHGGSPLRTYPGEGGLVKIPAAWLIEQAGFSKGYALGRAGISSRHTLALVNRGDGHGDGRGGATAEEILALAAKIAGAVEAKVGVRLEMEPEMVGF